MKDSAFKQVIWDFYKQNKRDLPWRKTINPYRIFLSEVMLQQTQVSRVSVKYPEFLKKYPDFQTLSRASLRDVLRVWQGMGYNRRALYLKQSAEILVNKYQGKVPKDPVVLDSLPGIGYATACSILTFAYNIPIVFIETNIRRVFIHFFFTKDNIDDAEILKLVERTLDRKNPRDWYFALMDYGAYLSKIVENPNRKSRHYKKQPKFEGSDRQVRGYILRKLIEKRRLTIDELRKEFPQKEDKINTILECLIEEKLIKELNGILLIHS